MRLIQAVLVITVLAGAMSMGTSQAAQNGCLHGRDATPEQKARRATLVGLARDVNNQQVKQQANGYLMMDGLTLTRPIPEGVEIKMAADAKGYSFSIVDTTDACRSGVFSNQAGIIYTGQALQ